MGAYSPSGTIVDLSTVSLQIGWLKRFIQRNAISAAQTVSALIYSEMGTLNTLIQGASSNQGLSASPTLPIGWNINPDPGIAKDSGVPGPTSTTVTGEVNA